MQLKARDIMRESVISLQADMTLTEAWNLLANNQISGAPVVSDAGMLVGVLSQTDLVREAFEREMSDFPVDSFYVGMPFIDPEYYGELSEKLDELTVEDAMSAQVITVESDDDISTIAVRMRTNHVHRVIVTEGGRLVGIVSALDLLRILESH